MGAGVETAVESDRRAPSDGEPRLSLRLLGPLSIARQGHELALPGSRKLRALLAYLALAPRPLPRSHLCELLWDVPNDPRAELRWCLTRIRRLVDEPGLQRVRTGGDAVWLELSDCAVDARTLAEAGEEGIGALRLARLRALAPLCAGEFLEGLEIERCPRFGSWLVAQRRRIDAVRTALLERLAEALPVDSREASACLEAWLALAPLDLRAHALLLQGLAREGRIAEAQAHLAATARLFEAEGLEPAPLLAAWRGALQRDEAAPASPAAAAPAFAAADPCDGASLATARRATIAVMPFVDESGEGQGGAAGGLAHDITTRLAKLHSLVVIAQASVQALAERRLTTGQVGRALDLDYLVGGSLRRQAGRILARVELTEVRNGRLLWAEVYDRRQDDTFRVLDDIGDSIVAAVADQVETAERNRAVLLHPSSLNAWECYHRGIWHMYRYRRGDNEAAQHFLERAVRLDPTFARAHAALSFTHFQNAFQRWRERGPEIDLAFEAACQGLLADERDPAAHHAMGRALWLRGHDDQAQVELGAAVALSPSFAHGHYSLSFVHAQSGDAQAAIRFSDRSHLLSPFDPLLCSMLTSRALALVRLGRVEEAADWSAKAIARPNVFAHLQAIAACLLAAAGRAGEARAAAAALRQELPDYRLADLLTTFRFTPEVVALFRDGGRRVGLE